MHLTKFAGGGAPLGASPLDALYGRVGQYYAEKIHVHGPTPRGVDWPCGMTQKLRFVQLLKISGSNRNFRLNDVGCGYGALLAFLRERYGRARIHYHGIDICSQMIDAAQSLWREDKGASFSVGCDSPSRADYSVASGIFNVKLNESDELWTQFIKVTIGRMFADSEIGAAVNFLATLPPAANPRHELYRSSPEFWANYCERELGAKVEVLSNYGIQEFTLLARH